MLKIFSPAKINLNLKITAKRNDGYHEIETIMQEISLRDTITLSNSNKFFELICQGINIPGNPNDNLIIKATDLFLIKINAFDQKKTLQITLFKNIPCGAGLGGGSSNAVATLIGLNSLFGSPLTHQELVKIAISLGSDTAFFMYQGQCLCTGRGEIVRPIDTKELPQKILLILPEIHVPTEKIFQSFQMKPTNANNHLENISFELFPKLKEMKNKASRIIESEILMSGSGSTLFSLIEQIKPSELKELKEIPNCSILESEFSYKGCYVSKD